MFRSMDETLSKKLRILADAAKYDASCSSSGAPKRVAGKDGLWGDKCFGPGVRAK
ncbi:hypothetical protein [Methylobacterium sp. sgz302541]|uniref:hypothetical protein n=1 Tax=unclassified Methylobacterium TaxID=2615210 RepID=UPI003D3278FA